MQFTLATLGLAALAAAVPAPQGVTSAISPSSTAPADCKSSYDGKFQIQVVNVTTSSGKAKRQSNTDGTLVITLENGVLKDQDQRTGYIAANSQFQFDGPPQTGAIYTAGFSVCGNGSLAIGNDAIFYGCLSGTFYNLYDENEAAQCTPVYINIVPYTGSGSSASASATGGQLSDGQPQASSVATSVASQLTDGQPQATPVSSAACITQISDGQPQACPTAAPVTQITDGQPQAPTYTPVSPITQISDGQPQAPTSPVTQISDGQVQAPTYTPVTQISDGQPQAPTNGSGVASPTVSIIPFTGAASMPTAKAVLGLAAGLLAFAL